MVKTIKRAIQNKLNSRCYKKYLAEKERQSDCYGQWYLRNEDWKMKHFPPAADESELVFFADKNGILEEKAKAVVTAFFREHPYVQLAYADEDCINENGKRYAPWFKPQWYPDTLAGFSYFGHFFAARRKLLDAAAPELWQDCLTDCDSEKCHTLLLRLTDYITKQRWILANDKRKEIASIDKVLIHQKRMSEPFSLQRKSGKLPKDARVSIIIPSKDNPKVLATCIESIRRKTLLADAQGNALWMEILVIDNGSLPENRKILSEMAKQYAFSYHYEPMPFNFSKMCNLGAERAKGDYLLFLNDDMEIIQEDWLLGLLEMAAMPHAGAVGAKLLYPDSDLIQHIGITNIKVGPVHKLLKQHDEISHYHGQNRHVYDMIGVTAACLLIAKEKFEEAGRFFEGMAVAYNDVDLNFSLYELGYYNIFRGDVALYHHESLSRGDDNLSDEKWLRLLKEKDILYTRHPSLKAFDPFYSRNLAPHSNLYLPAYLYAFEKRDYYTSVRKLKKNRVEKWENNCLVVNVEHAREEKKLEFTERDDVYWIEGWSYVLGMDNSRYARKLLLYGEAGSVYEAQVLDRYRKDVAEILPQQQNVALAGFVCRIPKDALPADTYHIAMLASDRCSGQKLLQKTEKSFTIR